MTLTPRPYLSFSAMALWEMSPEKWAEQYIYGKMMGANKNMAYGSLLAEGLEAEEATGDPLLDLMAAKLPKFELMDWVVHDEENGVEVRYLNPRTGEIEFHTVPVLEDRKQNIPILAKPDTAKADYTAFKEFKTSVRRWTQRMADESGQITFYATAIWLKTDRIPNDIELVDVVVEYDENGALRPTGELKRFPTKRTITDIIKMTSRMRKAWAGIKEICEKELI